MSRGFETLYRELGTSNAPRRARSKRRVLLEEDQKFDRLIRQACAEICGQSPRVARDFTLPVRHSLVRVE